MQAPLDPVSRAFGHLRRAAEVVPVPSFDERDDRLARLERLLIDHRDAFVEAIAEDFSVRGRGETLTADVLLTVDAVRYARRHLAKWMERTPAWPHPFFLPSKAFIEHLPRGVVGIIAPWNYPVNLALGPLAPALAAGNRVLVKPSELTPQTSALLARLVTDAFTAEEVAVVTGGADVARAVTQLPLDALLFTGSTHVGRLVAEACAKNLTPVTLELGGKSPALVHESYDLDLAAERIVVGKLFNAGQTCIAPDYVLVKKGSEHRFLEALKRSVAKAYPLLDGLTGIINERAHARLLRIVEDAKTKGARVEVLSDAPTSGRVMAPVALLDVRPDSIAMQEELFGPVLPIETYDSTDEAISRITSRPHPLAFYYFDDDTSRADRTLARVKSGGACVNDTLVHFAQESLPFGGVGASGLGAYHGRQGFETFSHARSVLVASRFSPARKLMAPPMGTLIEKAVSALVQGTRALRR